MAVSAFSILFVTGICCIRLYREFRSSREVHRQLKAIDHKLEQLCINTENMDVTLQEILQQMVRMEDMYAAALASASGASDRDGAQMR